MNQVKELAGQYNIYEVQKKPHELNETCPVAQVNKDFSPEKISILSERDPEELLKGPMIWECLACGLCREVTGGLLDMSRFIREVRRLANQAGFHGSETHGGILIAAQRMSSLSSLKPNRTGWVTGSLQVQPEKGECLYWAGGAPFFAAVMPELKPTAVQSAQAAVRLLNHLGITPVVLGHERFSGHDLLWTGDIEGFQRLADQNLRAVRESGAKRVIVSSPEDYHTLAVSYREYCGELGFEVRHISEFLLENIERLKFEKWQKKITYHDPCRLGRGMSVYDAPRQVLSSIPGVELLEMKNRKESSLCCGTSCWINCNRYSKLLQVNRLREAAATGAEILVTTCWECAIHFRCAMRSSAWQQVNIEVKDLSSLAASLLQE